MASCFLQKKKLTIKGIFEIVFFIFCAVFRSSFLLWESHGGIKKNTFISSRCDYNQCYCGLFVIVVCLLLLLFLRYNTKHFNDEATPKAVKDMLS